MKQEELSQYITKILRSIEDPNNEDRHFNITLDQELEGEIDLSEIIEKVITSLDYRYEDFRLFDYHIDLLIENKFNILKFNNRFPQSVKVQNCVGSKIIVSGGSSYWENIDVPLSSFSVSQAEVSKLDIRAPLATVTLENISGCKNLFIRGFTKEKSKFGQIKLWGGIENYHFRDLSSSQIWIQQSSNKTESKVEMEEIIVDVVVIRSDEPGPISIGSGEVGSILIRSSQSKSVNIQDLDCKKIDIFLQHHFSASVSLIGVRLLKNFRLEASVLKQLDVTELKFENIYLEKDFVGNVRNVILDSGVDFLNVSNQGELSFLNSIIRQKIFSSISSVLGRVSFFNCPSPNIIIFESSNIEQVQFYGNSGMLDVRTRNKDDKANLENQRAAMRQLKIASSKIGNKELSTAYRGKELILHSKLLNWRSHASEIIAIFLSRSNDHGQSWLRAIIIAACLSAVFFLIFIRTLGFVFSWEDGSFLTFLNIWSHYPEFLIPGYLYPSKNKFYYLIDLVNIMDFDSLCLDSKVVIFIHDIIVIPYLLVQTVSAFRKHLGKD